MKRTYRTSHVVALCTLIMLSVCIILCLYRRYAKRKMKEQINVEIDEAVKQYMSISNSDTEAKNRANADINLDSMEMNRQWGS
mmetsp:Transcript_4394/g.7448  ORF Transcript_4394/g.7448 Transcript_4394/m.7448 type:complete len:83 (-) Transcript_4394:113-361(-)